MRTMSKKKNKDRVKLPKRFLGVKIPKATRKNVNAMLKGVPAPAVKPVLTAAVGGLVAALAARLEGPLQELIESYTADPKRPRRKGETLPTSH
jgi:adenine/guanine phosphoribosyltransferase-like PRPP-binding protein